MPKKTKTFVIGDYVFAKVKGYAPWPAKITNIEKKKYTVYFYGTGETGYLKAEDLFHFNEKKDAFINDKAKKKPHFNQAVEQIVAEINNDDNQNVYVNSVHGQSELMDNDQETSVMDTDNDQSSALLTDTSNAIDQSSALLTDTNNDIDQSSALSKDTNIDIHQSSAVSKDTNIDIDQSNAVSTDTNIDIDQNNAVLTDTNNEIDQSNAVLMDTNKDIDQSILVLDTEMAARNVIWVDSDDERNTALLPDTNNQINQNLPMVHNNGGDQNIANHSPNILLVHSDSSDGDYDDDDQSVMSMEDDLNDLNNYNNFALNVGHSENSIEKENRNKMNMEIMNDMLEELDNKLHSGSIKSKIIDQKTLLKFAQSARMLCEASNANQTIVYDLVRSMKKRPNLPIVSRSGRTIKPKRRFDASPSPLLGDDAGDEVAKIPNEQMQRPEMGRMPIPGHRGKRPQPIIIRSIPEHRSRPPRQRPAVEHVHADFLMRLSPELQAEMDLLKLDHCVKQTVQLTIASPDKCMKYLREYKHLNLSAALLKKHPHCVETIKRLRGYVGNINDWFFTQEEKIEFMHKAFKIRTEAELIYHRFKSIFTYEGNGRFWDKFMAEVEKYQRNHTNPCGNVHCRPNELRRINNPYLIL